VFDPVLKQVLVGALAQRGHAQISGWQANNCYFAWRDRKYVLVAGGYHIQTHGSWYNFGCRCDIPLNHKFGRYGDAYFKLVGSGERPHWGLLALFASGSYSSTRVERAGVPLPVYLNLNQFPVLP
jgi:hypothetical protein